MATSPDAGDDARTGPIREPIDGGLRPRAGIFLTILELSAAAAAESWASPFASSCLVSFHRQYDAY